MHLKVRLDEVKACVLVLIGVRIDGSKELMAIDCGYRESGESWAGLLRACERRGMSAPLLAVGDGALGFWKAQRDIFPATCEQRCWVHKTANVLDALPRSAHPAVKAAITEIDNAEDKDQAAQAIGAFGRKCAARFPKAAAKITDGVDVLSVIYDFRLNTGSICARPTRSNPPSPPPDCAPGSLAAPAPARPRRR